MLGVWPIVLFEECFLRRPKGFVGRLPPLLLKDVSDDAGDLGVLAKLPGIGILDGFSPVSLGRLAGLLGLGLACSGGFRRRFGGLGLLLWLRRGFCRLCLRRLFGRRGCGFFYLRPPLHFV